MTCKAMVMACTGQMWGLFVWLERWRAEAAAGSTIILAAQACTPPPTHTLQDSGEWIDGAPPLVGAFDSTGAADMASSVVSAY